MRAILVLAGLSTLALGACTQQDAVATGSPLAGGARATALLKTGTGADAGRATVTEVAGGLRYTLDVKGLPAGTHGAHIHTTGRCDAPEFTTAGGHWNPTTMKHGSMNPQGPHEGDLPNLTIGTDGRGTLGVTVPGATLAGLLDADGAAIVVHAGPDDLMTDPSGNSGGRIACGVFAAA
ncbi:superoxide dismutase family protein [Sphingomonas sp. RP10(2022)]|uniref:Superoxide dismutase family protein n=1 Tax=Sphingomonas liriopis TaxID=2949094 RepID=A0A9X2HZQ8_9SPHN|nr:superoxide dismutase family protein [Sphingomonas liriopis]MCP3735105.1 superoxide dismutase family protein [Sphingomonas liriopis]